jgi:hypothetical protein
VFNVDEIIIWESAIDIRKKFPVLPKDPTKGFDPSGERIFKRRNREGWSFCKEPKFARKKVQGGFRTKHNSINIENDQFRLTNHDYKTYGRETW